MVQMGGGISPLDRRLLCRACKSNESSESGVVVKSTGVTYLYHHNMKLLSMHDGVSKRTPVYLHLFVFTRWKYRGASMLLHAVREL